MRETCVLSLFSRFFVCLSLAACASAPPHAADPSSIVEPRTTERCEATTGSRIPRCDRDEARVAPKVQVNPVPPTLLPKSLG
jgi:hypothetical protein